MDPNNTDWFDRIIDAAMLSFLDDFEAEFGRLPSEIEKHLWMRGFIDACTLLETAMTRSGMWK